MGLRRHRGSSSRICPGQLQQSPSAQLALSSCRTLGLLLLLAVVGLSALRLLPAGLPPGTDTGAVTVLVDGVGHVINVEEETIDKRGAYLTAVIFNRVFKEDLFNITAYECYQWIEYMLFAGVEHIFWYDAAHSDEESQQPYLQKFVDDGVLTYHRFRQLFPGDLDVGPLSETEQGYEEEHASQQDHSYEHFLATHSGGVSWVVEMDVDEYPFMVSDLRRSFLRRYVQYLEKARPDVTQVLMPCMTFGGNPMGDQENGWLIERYQRRKRTTEVVRDGFASRTKPIFKPNFARGVSAFDPHQFPMISGDTLVAPPEVLRMNHYWGPRLSDFKPDTSAVLALLVPDTSAQAIATDLREMTGLTMKAPFLAGAAEQVGFQAW